MATLWVFAASTVLGDGLDLKHVQQVHDHYGYPAGALGSALQAERRSTLVYLGSRTPGDHATMESGRLVSDRQADQFRVLALDKGALNVAPAAAKQLAGEIIAGLNGLAAKRTAIDAGRITRARAFSDFTNLLSQINSLQGSLSTLSNAEVSKDARNQVAMARAREALSQEDTFMAGALAAGRMTAVEHAEFIKLVGAQHSLYDLSAAELRPEERAYYARVIAMPEYNRLRVLERRLVGSFRISKVGPDFGIMWKTTADSNLTRLRGMELSSIAAADLRAKPIASSIILRVVLAGALGLFAVVASLILAVWLGRSVIRDLTGLRREALDLADTKLPSVIQRLRAGEEVDVAAEAPPLSFATEEIDQVGQAFNNARRTAIQGAVEEAALRRSVSDVFVNLARRSQSLLHRQLKLLDTMERRNNDPEELEDLFRLDHLATRMRRHAEGLIILSGQAPGRGWRNPVGVIDLARAAASEVEAYTRVTVAPMPEAAIAGVAVADVIHLLAELIENATMFSPNETTVEVRGQTAAHGFSLEIEDRGLSMDEESLVRANERLVSPPEFDLSDSAQLGLFVVSRLAKRHKIKVTLRTSPFGGMTAIVLIPDDLVVRAGAAAGDGPAELEGKPLALTRRSEDALVPLGAVRQDRDVPQPGQSPAGKRRAGQHRSAPRPLHEVGKGESPNASRESDPPRTGPQPFQLVRPSGPAKPSREPEADEPASPPAAQAQSPSQSDHQLPPLGGLQRTPSAGSTPRTSSPPARRAEGGRRASGGGRERPPLPKRAKQTSLAPQLYEDSTASAAPSETEPAAHRTPEQMRSMLSSIQQGTLRGRSQAAEGDEES
ncbi:MAG: hypothetical protein JWO67_918 [Streptosporangiaceae bacterium]|nr:hypothetical protein [Streptosporangiaceae bacterium]